MAVAAHPSHLDERLHDGKSGMRGRRRDCPADPGIGNLADRAATIANQELSAVRRRTLGAGHIGVQAGQPMDETLGDQELESPVHGDRCRALAVGGEPFQNLVGTDGNVALSDNFQDPPALGGQPDPTCLADGFGTGEDRRNAAAVIVIHSRKSTAHRSEGVRANHIDMLYYYI